MPESCQVLLQLLSWNKLAWTVTTTSRVPGHGVYMPPHQFCLLWKLCATWSPPSHSSSLLQPAWSRLGRPVLYLCLVSSGKMGSSSKWWQVVDLADWEPEDIKLSWLSQHFKAKYKYIKKRGLLHEHASSLELLTSRLHHCTDKWVHSFQKGDHSRHTQ